VSRGFGVVPTRERGEVSAEAGVIGGLGACDQLSHLETVQQATRTLLCCRRSGGQQANGHDRD
jgi:hypothetical protein